MVTMIGLHAIVSAAAAAAAGRLHSKATAADAHLHCNNLVLLGVQNSLIQYNYREIVFPFKMTNA